MMEINTVKDAYKFMYFKFGDNPTQADVSSFFGVPISDNLYRRGFLPKYMKVKELVDGKKIRQRLQSARQRVKYFFQRTTTDDGTITGDSVINLLKSQGFSCVICGIYLKKDAHKQLDHIKPLSKGGHHTLSNVQWLCRTCNIRKKDKYDA